MTHSDTPAPRGLAIAAIAVIVLGYLAAAALGLPQAGTRQILEAEAHHEDAHHDVPHGDEAHGEHGPAHGDGHHDPSHHDPSHHEASQHEAADHGHPAPPSLPTVLPFVLLLGSIAILPLLPATRHWWEFNRNRLLVAAALGLLTLLYYLLLHAHPVERHFLGHGLVAPGTRWFSLAMAWTVFQNAIFEEYIPFIVLLFSLYTISGGCRITGDLPARPLTNTTFLAVGGLAASFVGTTGAAMLLIRPLLETNHERRHVVHTVVFFIFVVCNCGGCLLPIGDPPLFLGYLAGVEFTWTFNLWPQWLAVNLGLLAIYYAWDRFVAYPRESARDIRRDETERVSLQFYGLKLNGALLLGVILSVALLAPTKPFPGTDWHPWLYLREAVQLALVGVSLAIGAPAVRLANRFNYAAIAEVAALFLGIFICMQPALQILEVRGPSLGIHSPAQFFWTTGMLSAVLDNAPTYLVFFQTARTLPSEGLSTMAGVTEARLAAISLGAVFMGALTYIGNGPNFMVKAIAESSGVKMPGFFGYMAYSCAVLLPLFVLVTLAFLIGS